MSDPDVPEVRRTRRPSYSIWDEPRPITRDSRWSGCTVTSARQRREIESGERVIVGVYRFEGEGGALEIPLLKVTEGREGGSESESQSSASPATTLSAGRRSTSGA